ncbi:histidine phosphatase family protein [Acidiphilium sp. PA]|uniref:histidine phosphatase family protein n=1 Tax=Acidiphilium sp. PA TaxID=2871705 RepID=UPI0022433A4B|nr:histidine phosphatase family protein [Acidiphilium sp. PA]MCW8308149.1 histidine phosphatase family protein [Acidiphilium sp. PA]
MSQVQPLTRFCLIRHAIVAPEYLPVLYGQMDVPICPSRLSSDSRRYASLGAILPKPAHWVVTPLSRTRATAEAIMQAGYGPVPLYVEAGLIEQDFGAWQGSAMTDFINRPTKHPFWPVGGEEIPPDGESFSQMRARVGPTMESLAKMHAGKTVIVVSHGGAIRAAIAEALQLTSDQALSLAVDNLSISRLEHYGHAWRVVSLNEQMSI